MVLQRPLSLYIPKREPTDVISRDIIDIILLSVLSALKMTSGKAAEVTSYFAITRLAFVR